MTELFTLDPRAVQLVRAETKDQILGLLAECFAQAYRLDRDEAFDRLEEREKLGSTGFGRGVALPHARVQGLQTPVAALLRLDSPVDFGSADGMAVGLVIGLLSPDQGGAAHLQALAALSRSMRSESLRNQLATAPDVDAIYALLSNDIDRDAA